MSFTTAFRAQKVDQDNCVTDEVPVKSLTTRNKVSFDDRVDSVGQPDRAFEVPFGETLRGRQLGPNWWEIGYQVKNQPKLDVVVRDLPAEGDITGVHHQATGQAKIDGKTYDLTTDVNVPSP